MGPIAKKVIATLVLVVIGFLGVTLVVQEARTKTMVTVAVPTATSAACTCATNPARTTKYLIFWKEKDSDFKASVTLFDSVVDASKTVPSTATHVRIVTVTLD